MTHTGILYGGVVDLLLGCRVWANSPSCSITCCCRQLHPRSEKVRAQALRETTEISSDRNLTNNVVCVMSRISSRKLTFERLRSMGFRLAIAAHGWDLLTPPSALFPFQVLMRVISVFFEDDFWEVTVEYECKLSGYCLLSGTKWIQFVPEHLPKREKYITLHSLHTIMRKYASFTVYV